MTGNTVHTTNRHCRLLGPNLKKHLLAKVDHSVYEKNRYCEKYINHPKSNPRIGSPSEFRRSLKIFLFGQWGHGTVWTLLTAPTRNIRILTLTLLTFVNVSSSKQDAQKNMAARLNYYHAKASQGLRDKSLNMSLKHVLPALHAVPIPSWFRRLVSRLPAISWTFLWTCAHTWFDAC